MKSPLPSFSLKIMFQTNYITQIAFNQRVRVIVFNATSNNISAISCQSVLLVDETGLSGENHLHTASH